MNRAVRYHIIYALLYCAAAELLFIGTAYGVPPGKSATIQATAFVEPASGVQSDSAGCWLVHVGSFSQVVLKVSDFANREAWAGRIDASRSAARAQRCHPVLFSPNGDLLRELSGSLPRIVTIVDPGQ